MKENSAITKEQAIKILQDAYYTSILPDKGGIIFDALKLAISALQSDPNAPDWSQAPEEANYYAIDEDEASFWFENCPTLYRGIYYPNGGLVKSAKSAKKKVHPKLFKRPE